MYFISSFSKFNHNGSIYGCFCDNVDQISDEWDSNKAYYGNCTTQNFMPGFGSIIKCVCKRDWCNQYFMFYKSGWSDVYT